MCVSRLSARWFGVSHRRNINKYVIVETFCVCMCRFPDAMNFLGNNFAAGERERESSEEQDDEEEVFNDSRSMGYGTHAFDSPALCACVFIAEYAVRFVQW